MIRGHVIEAVRVIFNRATERGHDVPEINDKKTKLKPPLSDSGPLQDCEFGMILLLVRGWFRDESFENEFFENIKSADFEKVVGLLVKRTVERVLVRMGDDEGGAGNHTAFFTGEPYSKHSKSGTTRYSANLDAAMITLAFLAPAIEEFNEQLAKLDHGLPEVQFPDWVKNQRDAALYVIQEGLRYAQECRVFQGTKFNGFTCDPESNAERPENGYLEREEDRLFFTWTACETINDMVAWRKSYLDRRLSVPLPDEATSRLKELITNLEGTLRDAAEWSRDRFLATFEKFEAEDNKELVREINQLKGKAPNPAQRDRLAQMATAVQHVYHLSQYAAIRSLVPENVSLKEVSTIMDKLDRLVSRSIISSGLDETEQADLFFTLTRKYSLGKWDTYGDDAWYPLVVRSLSGLLSRTLTDMGKRSARSDVLSLTLTFQRSLEGHVKNIIERRPSGGDQGADGKLWSFAEGQPYVLYATQRTIFALMRYADFLKAVDAFVNAPVDADKQEEELSLLMARTLANSLFRPVIRELLSQIPKVPVPTDVPIAPDAPSELPLPDENWAARIVCKWLLQFREDFKQFQIAAHLTQKANTLKFIKKYVDRYQPSKDLPDRKKEGARGQLEALKGEYQKICDSVPMIAQALTQSTKDSEIEGVLFDYLFRQYVSSAGSLKDLLQDDKTELWRLINDAKGTWEAISKTDPKAIVL